MKKNVLTTLCCLLVMATGLTSCNSPTSTSGNDPQTNISQDEKIITVYYFHGERRCTTCKAVGKVSSETVAEAFAGNPRVIFRDINIDEPENNELKDKLEMSGSGLYIFDGTTKEDLTAIAFQKAVDHPEELSSKIILTINGML